MSEVCQVQVQLLRKLQENSWRLSKEKSGKAQVKKSATLLNIYFFSRILLGLKQFVLLFIETGFINTILSKINFISSKFLLSAICCLIFYRQKSGNSLDREHKNICFMFCNNFSIKTPWACARNPRCIKKRSVGLQNLMFRKCNFQTQETSLTGVPCF